MPKRVEGQGKVFRAVIPRGRSRGKRDVSLAAIEDGDEKRRVSGGELKRP